MKRTLNSNNAILLCLVTYALAVPLAGAALVDDIARDLSPVSGLVVQVEGREVIIDLDASGGVTPSDVFSVLAPGKKVVHPVTQKVLGTLEEVKAVLKVVRLKRGFSFARPIEGADSIQKGDPIRRCYNLPAIFWDYTGEGKWFFQQLQDALPDLKWHEYESSQRSKPTEPAPLGGGPGTFVFIFTNEGLEVRDPEFTVLKTYPPPESTSKSSAVPSVPQATGLTTVDPKPPSFSGVPAVVQPVFSKAENLVNLPKVSLMADFVRHENRIRMASTDGRSVQIYELKHSAEHVADAELPRPGKILAVKWWKPSESSPLYLAVTAWIDQSVKSSLWKLQEGALLITRNDIPYLLGTFDIDRDGLPETLLAQEFDRDSFFSQRVSQVVLANNDLRQMEPKVLLPRQFTVLGSAITDVNSDGQPEVIFIRNQVLFIYAGSRQLYKSPKEMGGSVSVLTYNSSTSSANPEPATAIFEVNPLCMDLDRNGVPEIITAAAERTLIGSFAPSIPDTKRTWIAVIRYQNGRFESGVLGDKLDLPVQGLTVHDQQLLVVTTEAGGMTGEGEKSHLLAFSLGR